MKLDDVNVQLCLVIYNDRINSYRLMKLLDKKLDEEPTSTDIKEMAETRIRNLQCFAELKSYNDKKTFTRQHPLVLHQLDYRDLTRLWLYDRNLFFNKHRNCINNIYRYKGLLADKTLSEQNRLKYEMLLAKHTSRSSIFQSIVDGNLLKTNSYE